MELLSVPFVFKEYFEEMAIPVARRWTHHSPKTFVQLFFHVFFGHSILHRLLFLLTVEVSPIP